MKSREDVNLLKSQWNRDACWDIEETEGFEEYRDELRSYRQDQELSRLEKARKHYEQLASKICPMSMAYIHQNSDDTGFGYDTCKVEKCAWWNKGNECCGILASRGFWGGVELI